MPSAAIFIALMMVIFFNIGKDDVAQKVRSEMVRQGVENAAAEAKSYSAAAKASAAAADSHKATAGKSAAAVGEIRAKVESARANFDAIARDVIGRDARVLYSGIRKSGNNGTMPCSMFCEDNTKGHEKFVGKCFSAVIIAAPEGGDKKRIGQYVSCNTAEGNGYHMHCYCAPAALKN